MREGNVDIRGEIADGCNSGSQLQEGTTGLALQLQVPMHVPEARQNCLALGIDHRGLGVWAQ
jgi:hypothetical protein